jgi:hypothetical protein
MVQGLCFIKAIFMAKTDKATSQSLRLPRSITPESGEYKEGLARQSHIFPGFPR